MEVEVMNGYFDLSVVESVEAGVVVFVDDKQMMVKDTLDELMVEKMFLCKSRKI